MKYENEWQDFKSLNGVDLTYEEFCRLKEEEANHRQVEAERKEMIGDMQSSTAEESNAKCNICGSGLLYVEHTLYGNRCVFCVGGSGISLCYKMPLLNWLRWAYYDLMIYRQLVRLLKKEDGKMFYLAALGNMGYQNINECVGPTNRKRLWKELKKL
uniref:Uncharacterized protein n=1 Tax=viral metagenome TaxID=1070528 RepID=A0A6H1ZWH4_9ZZZZ